MSINYVLTVVGTDRIGIVEQVTDLVLKSKCNIHASRMARLGGEFAMMLHVTARQDELGVLRQHTGNLESEGFITNIVETRPSDTSRYIGWVPYRIMASGADHEGVVHEISAFLAKHQVNIEDMETSVVNSPMSGTPLFTIEATIIVPPELTLNKLNRGLEKIGEAVNMDIEVSSHQS